MLRSKMVFCFSTRSLLLFLLLHHRLQDSHCFTPPCSSPSPTAGPALHPHPHLRRTPVCLRSTVDDDDEELPAPRSRRRGRGWGGRGSEEEEEEADEREYLAARPEAFKKRLKVKRGEWMTMEASCLILGGVSGTSRDDLILVARVSGPLTPYLEGLVVLAHTRRPR